MLRRPGGTRVLCNSPALIAAAAAAGWVATAWPALYSPAASATLPLRGGELSWPSVAHGAGLDSAAAAAAAADVLVGVYGSELLATVGSRPGSVLVQILPPARSRGLRPLPGASLESVPLRQGKGAEFVTQAALAGMWPMSWQVPANFSGRGRCMAAPLNGLGHVLRRARELLDAGAPGDGVLPAFIVGAP